MKAIKERVRRRITGEGQTLHEATKNNNKKIVFRLLDAGENVNAKDKHGLTALHIACWYDYKDLVRLLLERGADVHATNEDGKTSLTLAKQKGHVQVVFLLEDVLSKMEAARRAPRSHATVLSGYTAPTTSTGSATEYPMSMQLSTKVKRISFLEDDKRIDYHTETNNTSKTVCTCETIETSAAVASLSAIVETSDTHVSSSESVKTSAAATSLSETTICTSETVVASTCGNGELAPNRDPAKSLSCEIKTRVALDTEIKRCRKLIELANDVCSDGFFAQASKPALERLEELLSLRNKDEYTPASELKERIAKLHEQINQASSESQQDLISTLRALEQQYQNEIDAEQELRAIEETRYRRLVPAALDNGKEDIQQQQQYVSELHGTAPTSSVYYRATRYDTLTVFQARPLVWCDKNGNCHPMDAPDFAKEKRELLAVVEESKTVGGDIQLIFEEANVDRLGAFLATSLSPVLHFSCHGHPKYLAIENKGALQQLHVEELRGFVSAGRGHLKMVFVSACHSRPAGEAFLAAGVKHVVCCKTDDQLRDSASIIFEEHFYRALACGRKLKAAFDLAKYMVQVTPQPDGNSLAEKDKFLLLPERADDDSYHDVDVFYTTPMSSMPTSMLARLGPNMNLPPPPTGFLGREVPLYKLVNELALEETNPRLILIKGPAGIGKASLAKAACSYIGDRSRTFRIYDCEWVPLVHNADTEISMILHQLYEKFKDDKIQSGSCTDFKACIGEVVKVVKKKCALIVIDARELKSKFAREKLDTFLSNLFLWSSHVRVMIICPAGHDFSFKPKCLTSRLSLGPLDMRSSVLLFGNYCDFVAQRRIPGVGSSEVLAKLLVPDSFRDDAKAQVIFSIVGEGNPARILKAATEITDANYILLVRTGILQLEENISLVSRHLDRLPSTNVDEIDQWKDVLEDLTKLRDTLPALPELDSQNA